MGTGRTLNKKPATRPVKNGAARRKRENDHKKRLVALGADEETVRRMTTQDIRRKLQRPLKTAAELARKAS